MCDLGFAFLTIACASQRLDTSWITVSENEMERVVLQSYRLFNLSVDWLSTANTEVICHYIGREIVSVNIRYRQTMNQRDLPTQIGQRFSTSVIS